MMKAVYLLWPDQHYIEKLVLAGINYLIFALYNPRPDMQYQNDAFWTYEKVLDSISYCEKFRPAVKVGIIINWWNPWYDPIPQSDQFFDGQRYHEQTPCPTSSRHHSWMLSYPLDLYKAKIVDFIFVDFEDYGAAQSDERLYYYRDWDKGGLQCKCQRCSSMNEERQRKINASYIHTLLVNTVKESGEYAYPDPILWKGFPGDRWWLNAFTYEKWDPWRRILQHTMKPKWSHGVTAQISCGAWIDKFTASDYLKHLWKIGSSACCDGYWIYSHRRLSRFADERALDDKNPYNKLIDDSNDPAGDPLFFDKLKELNAKIDKHRDGSWFKREKWIAGIFR